MRDSLSRGQAIASVVALGVAVGVAVLLLLIGSDDAGEALRAFFLAPFGNRYYLGNMLDSASYLLLAALGVVISFRAGLYNLGGEGQILVGALVGTLVGLAMPDSPGWLGKIAVLATGAAVGGAMAGVCGVLRHLWKTPEIITTFLLSAALLPVAEFIITGPANDPERNLMATSLLPRELWLTRLLPPSTLNTTLVMAIICAGFVFFVMFRTVIGYDLRLFGHNEQFAVYSGISDAPVTTGALAASGALHGLTGALLVLGTHHATISGISAGIGWNAIAVALVARLHPLAAIPAAAFFSYLEAGAKTSMLHTSFTFELGAVMQGMIFLLVTATFVVPRFWRRR
jgi:ABC-type uncharacterized transport system permease subunit